MWWWVGCVEPATLDTGGTADPGTAPVSTVPTDPDALVDWLAVAEYRAWPGEAGAHPSSGPHFGEVRTWLSPALATSLEAGGDPHPLGAAAVKELYGDGTDVLGHSVMVRVGEGAGDNAWFWYEAFRGTVYADARGEGLCSGCHEDGMDHILTPWPQ